MFVITLPPEHIYDSEIPQYLKSIWVDVNHPTAEECKHEDVVSVAGVLSWGPEFSTRPTDGIHSRTKILPS